MDAVTEAITGIVTGQLLDDVFELRFPRSVDDGLPNGDLLKWAEHTPSEVESALFELTWPVLHQLSLLRHYGTNEIARVCLSVLLDKTPTELQPTRAVAMIVLLDQCPRMFHTRDATNARWVNGFFDPIAQHIVWYFIRRTDILSYECWQPLGFSFGYFLVITTFILTAAVHSEVLEQHDFLRVLIGKRRATVFEQTGMNDPFTSGLIDFSDPLAFPQLMMRGKPAVKDVYEYAYLRMAINEAHYPILRAFGRYPWRNGSLGRRSTDVESEFLRATSNFGAPPQDVQDLILADIEGGRWAAFY